jgi:redox-sensitive bicupin YhaK (pirin superfamily)
MITVRRSDERGHANHGWLDTRHTFSFDRYFDPRHMGFRSLRVINEDSVAGGRGFGTHPHRDMEIITYVIEGALEHKDSMGTSSVIRPGEVQRMTAGTGVTHSEYNPSQTEAVHLLQIWILPEQDGLTPEYEQRAFPVEGKQGKLRLVAARDGGDGVVNIHQDVSLYDASLAPGEKVSHQLEAGRGAWLQIVNGALKVNGATLERGDGASVNDETELTIEAVEQSDFLLFDLA